MPCRAQPRLLVLQVDVACAQGLWKPDAGQSFIMYLNCGIAKTYRMRITNEFLSHMPCDCHNLKCSYVEPR